MQEKKKTCRVHGLSSDRKDRAGRPAKLLSGLSTRSFFTMALVARKDNLLQSRESEISEDNSLLTYFNGRDKLFAGRGK